MQSRICSRCYRVLSGVTGTNYLVEDVSLVLCGTCEKEIGESFWLSRPEIIRSLAKRVARRIAQPHQDNLSYILGSMSERINAHEHAGTH